MTPDRPKISVVVASHNAWASIEECLTGLVDQRPEGGVEIVVVDNSTDGTTELIRKRFSDIPLIVRSPSALIPELWEVGIRQTTADIVALTTANCIPGTEWLTKILRAHENSSYPGIGGAIESDTSTGLVEWAIYFCRYSPYMLPFSQQVVRDIPGDNASYKRWALDRCQDVRRNGFWEPQVHAELRKDGLQLLMEPSIVVYHKKSFNVPDFIRQRFWHGRQFGSVRALQISSLWRVIYILLSPMIPLVFLARITRQVLTKKRHVLKLLLSLPLLTLFLLSWSAGELSGYVQAQKS